jgi:hypothetical protein
MKTMTDLEFEALWAKAKERDAKEAEAFKAKMAALSPGERKRIEQETENTRLWEDYTSED